MYESKDLAPLSAFRAVAGEEALSHAILIFTHCGTLGIDAFAERVRSSENRHLRAAVKCCQAVLGVDSLSLQRVH